MSQTAADDADEQALDAVVDGTLVLNDPEMDALTLHRFIEDVAQKIHAYPVVATRYGFEDQKHMAAFIGANEELRRRLKTRRAIWESDGNAEARARAYAIQGILEALPDTLAILHDQSVHVASRLDALKTHARIAGIDGMPTQGKDSGGVPVGGRFSINFVFKSAGSVEQITTVGREPPIIEAEAE